MSSLAGNDGGMEKLLALQERQTVALEALAADPVIQVESGPPVCPFCERMNPVVLVRESEARGPLGEFVIQAQCQQCQHTFYALPIMWETVKTQSEASEVNDERKQRLAGQ